MKKDAKYVRFMLDGCDIQFVATAPEDITLKQLLKQCNRIVPNYCACGIRGLDISEKGTPVDLAIEYDDIFKLDDDVSCAILPNGQSKMELWEDV